LNKTHLSLLVASLTFQNYISFERCFVRSGKKINLYVKYMKYFSEYRNNYRRRISFWNLCYLHFYYYLCLLKCRLKFGLNGRDAVREKSSLYWHRYITVNSLYETPKCDILPKSVPFIELSVYWTSTKWRPVAY
jgi:hypothetical protein